MKRSPIFALVLIASAFSQVLSADADDSIIRTELNHIRHALLSFYSEQGQLPGSLDQAGYHLAKSLQGKYTAGFQVFNSVDASFAGYLKPLSPQGGYSYSILASGDIQGINQFASGAEMLASLCAEVTAFQTAQEAYYAEQGHYYSGVASDIGFLEFSPNRHFGTLITTANERTYSAAAVVFNAPGILGASAYLGRKISVVPGKPPMGCGRAK